VPLYYSLAPNVLRVDRNILEKEFLDLADIEGLVLLKSLTGYWIRQ
jgi:type I restriction enzyme R subunit